MCRKTSKHNGILREQGLLALKFKTVEVRKYVRSWELHAYNYVSKGIITIYICTHIHTHIDIHIHTYIDKCVCTYIYICTHMYICMCTHIDIYIHTYIDT